jgi:hypothetical protein
MMPKERAGFEPYAWWIARQQIGLCLRKRYPVSQLPPHLLTLVRKLEAAEGNQLSQTLVGELDATEDSQLA